LEVGKALSEHETKDGYQNFKEAKIATRLAYIAQQHGLEILHCNNLPMPSLAE